MTTTVLKRFKMTLASPDAPFAGVAAPDPDLIAQYRAVRQLSEALCQPLEIEDYGVQSMADVSPPKWHLAHTTWFFETFLLYPYQAGYEAFHPGYGYLFNSYYEAVGDRHPRPQRGLLSRPTVAEVYQYRAHVDQAMAQLWQQTVDRPAVAELVTLGLHHEQQHQELLLTDLKYNLAINPLYPVYRPNVAQGEAATPAPLEFVEFAGGLYTIGHQAPGFAFDNEGPAHRVYQPDFALAQRLVTNGDYLEFIAAGGYQTAAHWLAEGWAMVQNEGWQAPLYWQKRGGDWWVFTLGGLKPNPSATSAILKPMPLPNGGAAVYPPKPSGRSPPPRFPSKATCWPLTICTPNLPSALAPSTNSTATPGNGPRAPTCPTPAFAPPPEPWENITASLCATRWCCGAAPA